MNRYGKIATLFIIFIMLFITVFSFSACKKQEKKAILILPGIMGSIYYTVDNDTGEKMAIWSGESTDEFLKSFQNMHLLICDDEGKPLHDNAYVAGWDDKDLWKYGANLRVMPGPDQKEGEGDVLRKLTEDLEEAVGSTYDVRVYQYDWRLDLRYLAEQLENFINTQGYTEVVLITHSMGGMVASHYLARSEANCAKTSLFIPISCPFLGSVEIYSYMETGAFPGFDNMGLDIGKITGFGNTICSAYQLFPSRALYQSYPEGISPITVNNEPLSYDQAFELLKLRKWAQKKDSLGYRPQFDSIEESVGLLYDTEGKHVTSKVSTFFIAGNGYQTRYNINYTSATKEAVYDNLNQEDTINKTVSGDSVVPLYSATLGQIDKENKATASNVMIYNTDKYSHMYITTAPVVKEKVMELIKALG